VVVRRLAEHVAATMPLVAVLFVPIGLGLSTLYPWAAPGAAEHDALLAGKSGWLQPSFFLLRSAVYLVVWSALAGWLRRRSVAQDAAAAPAAARRLQTASAPAMVLYAVTVTFAAFDWVMSLDPHWYSTIFGVYLFSGCVVAIYAALALLAMALQRSGALGGEMVNAEHYHDMGKLLFGFVVFWAYIAFSQYLLIWYGNIPEETAWFAHRLEHGWQAASIALALGHFVLPFFFLLPRQVKRRRPLLATAAVWLLALHWLDLYWLVVPTVPGASPAPGAADALLGLGTAALWLAAFAALARRPALLPVHDPRLAESLSFENV
jgi:hypothetical protein